MGERPDHFGSLEATAAGYASVTPFLDDEIAVLPDLLLTRWATTAVISAWRVRNYPENAEYITGWDAGVWAMLDAYRDMGLAEYQRRIREAMNAATRADRSAPRAERLVRRAGGTSPAAARVGDLTAHLRPAAAPGPRARRMALRRRRACVPGLLQQRPRRGARAPAGRRGHRPPGGDAQHERALPPRFGAGARRTADRDHAGRARHRDARELRQRGERPRVAPGDDRHRRDGRPRHRVRVPRRDHRHRRPLTRGVEDAASLHRTSRPSRRPTAIAARIGARNPVGPTRYAAHVDEALAELDARGVRPAAMVVDSGFTSDGIFTPPAEYLQDAVRRWRDAGGLFVADEVQSGFGRPGSHLWGFDVHGVVPDIVTLGKPMGNGHPVAAVMTRADIVDRFARETEWFSTFGGQPRRVRGVARRARRDRTGTCAGQCGGTGRLDPSRPRRAHDPARVDRRRALARTADRHRAGAGSWIRASRRRSRPGVVLNAMREHGVLVGTTGRQSNVLKVRPPLVITGEEAEVLVSTLDRVFDGARADGVAGRGSGIVDPWTSCWASRATACTRNAVLTDTSGTAPGRGGQRRFLRLGPERHRGGGERAPIVRHRGVERRGAGRRDDVEASVFALAGVDFPVDERRLAGIPEAIGLGGRCRIVNDSFAALRAGTDRAVRRRHHRRYRLGHRGSEPQRRGVPEPRTRPGVRRLRERDRRLRGRAQGGRRRVHRPRAPDRR